MSWAASVANATGHVLVRGRLLLSHAAVKGASAAPGLRGGKGRGRGRILACSLASACEEAIPVATESSVSLSEASKTHKKTRAFREDGAGVPASPGVAGVRASARSRPRCLCPVPPGGRDALTRPVRDRFPGRGVGWSWRSLACPRAARRRLLPSPPARALGEGATPERDAALWALYAVPQSPREGSPQARPAWPRPPSRVPASSEARGWPSPGGPGRRQGPEPGSPPLPVWQVPRVRGQMQK